MTLPTALAWQEVHFSIAHADVRQITQLGNGVRRALDRLHGIQTAQACLWQMELEKHLSIYNHRLI